MKIKAQYVYQVLIILLISLLVVGYLVNKKNSASKKNEISSIAQQLKIRNQQIAKIQKNLINPKYITFSALIENKTIRKFENYKISKYQTKDILFNANIKAVGSGFIDFFNNDQNIILSTYDGIFAFANINDLTEFTKIKSNISDLIKNEEFYLHDHYGIKDIFADKDNFYVSFIGKKKDDCYDLKILTSKINYQYLNFQKFYETVDCVDKNNNHEYYAHQGAGGRIFKVED